LGKTTGVLAPHEFWYFWRRFFPSGEIQQINEEKIDPDKMNIFLSELAGLENVLDKPLALKALILNWNIAYLSKVLENAIFLYIRREPFFNIQSLLHARIKFYNSISQWYSFKPPEYKWLKDCSPYHQVAGQVYYTNKSIQKGLCKLDRNRWLEIKYEDFCDHPEKVWNGLADKLLYYETHIPRKYLGSNRFQNTNKITVTESEKKRIISAYQDFFRIDIIANNDKKNGEKSKKNSFFNRSEMDVKAYG
jgi:hypothetical protein